MWMRWLGKVAVDTGCGHGGISMAGGGWGAVDVEMMSNQRYGELGVVTGCGHGGISMAGGGWGQWM